MKNITIILFTIILSSALTQIDGANCVSVSIRGVGTKKETKSKAEKDAIRLWQKNVQKMMGTKWIDWHKANDKRMECYITIKNNKRLHYCIASARPCKIN